MSDPYWCDPADYLPVEPRHESLLGRMTESIGQALWSDVQADSERIEAEGILFLAEHVETLFTSSMGWGWIRCCRWIRIPGTLVITRLRLRFVGWAPAPQRMVDIHFSDPDVLKVEAALNSRGRLVINVPKNAGTSFRRHWRFDRKFRIETPRAQEALDILVTALDQARQQQPPGQQNSLSDRT